MAAESQVTPEAAPAPAAPATLPPKALQAKLAASEQETQGPSPTARQGSSEASSADSNTSDAELPASDADAVEAAKVQQPQNGVQPHGSTSDGQAEQNGHGPEAGGKAKQASGFSLSASAASFVPGSGSAANGASSTSDGGAPSLANRHSGAQDAQVRGQRSDTAGAEGGEYWADGWSGPNGEYAYGEYSDGQSYGYGYAYDETSGWYYPVYPEEYYGSYYDGAANGRPKPRKTRPRKVKGPFASQGEGGVEGEAAVAAPDSVLEFGTIRATSLPLGFNLPDALDGTQASMDGSGPAALAAGGQQAAVEASTAQRVEAGMAVLRNNLPGLSLGSLRDLLERAQGDVLQALSGLAQQELAAPAPRQQEVPLLDEENFPSLGSTHGPKSPGDSQSPRSKSETSPKAEDSPKAPRDGFAAAAAKPPAAEGKENRPRNGKPQASKPADKKQTMEAHHWVETGAAVSSMYRQAREEASKHASVRNMCFQQAQMAYLAGNKGQAKQLSMEGRAANERMHAAHAAAASAIYQQRNPSGKGGQQRTMDLHGLHVNEAITQLANHISHARISSQLAPLSVIVGTGTHTKGAHHPSRLPTAVRDWLTANYVPFKEPVPGMLHLQL